MLTSAVDDASAPAPPDDLWLTVGELAEARGVTRQSVHQALQRWVDRGTPVETRMQGREIAVNVRDYDLRRGETVSLPHVAGEDTKALAAPGAAPGVAPGSSPAESSFGREQARKAGYEAELKKIELDRALGRLVETADVVVAAENAAAAMAALLDRLHMRAEDIHAAGQRDGLAGTRTALKVVRRDLMALIAEEFAKMAATALGETGGGA